MQMNKTETVKTTQQTTSKPKLVKGIKKQQVPRPCLPTFVI
jgi:hypothetical protein